MTIGVFSLDDPVTRRLMALLEQRRPGAGRFFDLSLAGESLVVERDRLTWNGEDLTALEAAWVYRFAYQNPVVPEPGEGREWSVWRADYLAEQQRFSTLMSAFRELERRGGALLNGTQAALGDFLRFARLEQLRRAGAPVPPLLSSNQADVVRRFQQQHPALVWRPNTGRAAWQLFTDKQREALVQPQLPPVMLAPLRRGPLVRAWLLNGEPVLCLRQQAPLANAPHETLEQLWHQPCPQAEAVLAQVARTLNLGWAMVLLVLDESGPPWVYDVDADPLLEWLPDPLQGHLLERLADHLCGIPPSAEVPESLTRPLERPTLFLRRMLRILFQFEASKYS